ncbi:MAG: hypothetical protein JEZ09_15915 [Salinivirgaceae bacterium]|nr:hypothetical protein [Salinivirgaceae bacterium]
MKTKFKIKDYIFNFKNDLTTIKLEKEIVLISLFLVFFLIYSLFKNINFFLNDFSSLYISQATKDGVDVTKRVQLFYKAFFSTFILIPLVYFGLYKLVRKFKITTEHLSLPLIFSCTGIFLIITDILNIQSDKSILVSLLIVCISLLPMFILKNPKQRKQFNILLPITLSISLVILTGLLFLFNSNNIFNNYSVELYLTISITLTVLIILIRKTFGIPSKKQLGYLLPLFLTPAIIFLSIELLFLIKLKCDFFIPYKKIFLALMGLSFIIIFILKSSNNFNYNTLKTSRFFFVPSALFSFLLLIHYTPIVHQPTDVFELANPANALMRIFTFKEIPFIDFMSSHMFSEQFYGILYNLIFGNSNDLSFLTFDFLYVFIFVTIVYIFLIKILENPFLILAFIIFMPFLINFFSIHLMYGVLAFFAVQKLIKKQTIRNYTFLFVTLIALILWRLDTGSATLMATTFFLPFAFFSKRKKISFRPMIISLMVLVVVIAIIIILTYLLSPSGYLVDNFKTALHYISANQAHGYTNIFTGTNHQFYIYHVLFPVTSILFIFYILYALRNNLLLAPKTSNYAIMASLFFYLIYIANFQRGIVRHGFIEGTDSFSASTFYLATSLFLFSLTKAIHIKWKYILFFSLSFSLFLFLKYFPIENDKSDSEKFLSSQTLKNFDDNLNTQNFKGRVSGKKEYAEKNYAQIKHFLNKNFSKEQTFLDFSNTPMLYYYCQRKVPSYFCQNLQNTVDDYLQEQHLKNITQKKVPVVIFSNYPKNWFDNTDGVPNEMRQYLMAEYIFDNYEPFGIMNNHSIWIAKNINIENNNREIDTLCLKPQIHNYKKAALAISNHFKDKNYSGLVPIFSSSINTNFISIDTSIAKRKNLFLEINLESAHNNDTYIIEFFQNSTKISTTTFTSQTKESNYMIRVSNHYLWHKKTATHLKITQKKKKNTNISHITFYSDKRYEYQNTNNY